MGNNDYTTTDNYITKELHAEFAKRVEEENCRQNHRIAQLEVGLMRLTDITTSIERLSVNMENMVKEQQSQGARLCELESADGKKWRQVITTIISSVVTLGLGFLAGKFGIK